VYAAQVVDGVVAQVIVGSAVWAAERLGGVWVGSDVLVGIGWSYVDGVVVAPEPEPSDGDVEVDW
jgi:hypothetical protein